MVDWLEILRECSETVREAVLPLLKAPQNQPSHRKGAGGDTTHQIDRVAENAIINTIKKHNIAFTLISEEAGIKKFGKKPEYYVTTDPIDGTTNALRGIPFVATSIAVSRKPNLQSVETALVTDLYHNKIYTAQRNQGAYKNNKKIATSDTTRLETAVVGVDFNTYKTTQHINAITAILQNTKHPRHLGADALEICYVADGTSDAFVDLRGKLRVTDMAAAMLILIEAGGNVTTPEGEKLDAPLSPTQKVSFIAAGNKTIHKRIKDLVMKYQRTVS
ncbi:MAG: inositol monophosphatase family protein [Candidatus Bathyarchaeia archaeon]